MRNYAVHTIGLILTVSSFAALASGCSKVQSKNQGDSAQTGQSSTGQSSTSASGSQNQQTIEGCVVRRETDLYIQPATGDATKLSASGQDVSSKVGQHVRVTGNTGASGQAASGTSGSTGTSGSSGSSGMSGSSASGAGANEPQLLVTGVEVVAEACPPEIQKKINQQNTSKNPK